MNDVHDGSPPTWHNPYDNGSSRPSGVERPAPYGAPSYGQAPYGEAQYGEAPYGTGDAHYGAQSDSRDALLERLRHPGELFARAMRGYDPTEVDAFFQQIARECERQRAGQPPRFGATHIRHVTFATGINGYATAQVDVAVAEMADELDRSARAGRTLRTGEPDGPDGPREPAYPSGVPLVTPQAIQAVDFTRTMRGYGMPEVDLFLDRVTGELARLHAGQPASLNLEAIRQVTFPRVARGYKVTEVDAFLDTIAAELQRLHAGRPPE